MKTNHLQKYITEPKNEFIFDFISIDLESKIKTECGEIIQKGLFRTDMNRAIRVYIHSNEHLPIHFHVESRQRYLDEKFNINPLEWVKNRILAPGVKKDINYIIKYFTDNPQYLKEIEYEFKRLNPNLPYV
jgi:hypothetical protein